MKSYNNDTINKFLSIIEKTGSKLFILCLFLATTGILLLYLFNDNVYTKYIKYIGIAFLSISFFVAIYLIYHFIREDNVKSLEKEYKKIIREKDTIINQLSNQLSYSNMNTTSIKNGKFSTNKEEYQNSVSKTIEQTQNL